MHAPTCTEIVNCIYFFNQDLPQVFFFWPEKVSIMAAAPVTFTHVEGLDDGMGPDSKALGGSQVFGVDRSVLDNHFKTLDTYC